MEDSYAHQTSGKINLVGLPEEIIVALPAYIRNIEDLNNFACTCSKIRRIVNATHPNTILRLADASASMFFRPCPHFLVAATARELSAWAVQSPDNTHKLRQAFQSGIDGLYALCLAKCGLTFARIRALHLLRFRILNPLSDAIDRLAGAQWYTTPDFWDGGVSEPFTVTCEPDRQALQIVIYNELFSATLDAWLQPDLQRPKLDLETRLDYIKYCIPDWCCIGGYPGLEVLPVGPYAGELDERDLPAAQGALDHILNCGRWMRPWKRACRATGAGFDDEWRQRLWLCAAQMQGIEGMEAMLSDTGLERQYENLREVYAQVAALAEQQKPETHHIGRLRSPVSEAPDFAKEVRVCMTRLWMHP